MLPFKFMNFVPYAALRLDFLKRFMEVLQFSMGFKLLNHLLRYQTSSPVLKMKSVYSYFLPK